MKNRRKSSSVNIFEIFSDVVLLMLATFVFLLVTILMTLRMEQEYQLPKLKKEVEELRSQLEVSKKKNNRLSMELDDLAEQGKEPQMKRMLSAAHLGQGRGRKDFEIFIEGLKDLPGTNLHLVVDATGSMHGISSFLIPILRVIVIRSGKNLDAITWFSDGKAKTYTGLMGEILDQFIKGAPFIGTNETIGDAFNRAAKNAKVLRAYLLIGDEPSSDRIFFLDIHIAFSVFIKRFKVSN